MKTFVCKCGNTIFYENTRCVCCGTDLGWCPVCTAMTSLLPEEEGHYRCGNSDCNELLCKCNNYSDHQVCNQCVTVSSDAERPEGLCDYCDFNDTIPDLTVPGNREMWKRLEEAKRRLLYTLDLMRLPYGRKSDDTLPELNFDFKADPVVKANQWWWSSW